MSGTSADRLGTAAARRTDRSLGGRVHRPRWLTIEGVIGIIAGAVVLVQPDRAIALFAVVLGVVLLFAAGWFIGSTIKPPAGQTRGRSALLAVVGFAAGVGILAYPAVGAVVLVIGVAVWLLVTGGYDIASARTASNPRGLSTATGVVSVVVGLMLPLPPVSIIFTDGVLVIATGVGLIALGILQLVRASKIKRRAG